MKKLFIILLLLLIAPCQSIATVTGGVISASGVTNNTVKVTITTAATDIDSLAICYHATVSGSDTTYAALIDSTTTSALITGLSERQGIVVFVRARSAAGNVAISNKDTTNTYKTQIQPDDLNYDGGFLFRILQTDKSWPVKDDYETIDTTFNLSGIGDTDKSLIVRIGEYNGLNLVAAQAGDSCAFTAYFKPVDMITSISDTSFYIGAVKDSLAFGSAGSPTQGLVVGSLKDLPVSRFWQISFLSHTGNGKDVTVTAKFMSDGSPSK